MFGLPISSLPYLSSNNKIVTFQGHIFFSLTEFVSNIKTVFILKARFAVPFCQTLLLGALDTVNIYHNKGYFL